ncbi:MAG: GNAT family N-acetyltransferase [Bacteroidetes bacterium]|nr:GNAT family N-acetyltransferase [Bacteroidota bacterium]
MSTAHYTCLKKHRFTDGEYAICTIRREDIMLIREWRNRQIDVLRQKKEITPEEQINYFEKQVWPTLALKEPKQVLVSFFHQGNVIGYGGLVHISWEDYRAEMSFLLNPDRHGKQQYEQDFSAFIGLIRQMAFQDLGIHRVFTETYNIRDWHISILEKNGFDLEGTMRDHVFIDGKFVDSLIHGSLSSKR